MTIHLAADKTEAWITRRAGHTSSQMVARYTRLAATAAEANLGELSPLDELLWPESKRVPRRVELPTNALGNRPGAAQGNETSVISQRPDPPSDKNRPHGAPYKPQGAPWDDPIDAALAVVLRGATEAGEWAVITTLAAELTARRQAREAEQAQANVPFGENVVSLDPARSRRGQGR